MRLGAHDIGIDDLRAMTTRPSESRPFPSRLDDKNAEFEIAIDSTFIDLWKDSTLQSVANKRLLPSLLNDFEEGCWRMEKFRNLVWDNIAETALSHRERAALSGQPPSLLRRESKPRGD